MRKLYPFTPSLLPPGKRLHTLLSPLYKRLFTGSSSSTTSSTRKPPNIQYLPLESVENLDRYRAGGYHPLSIGDSLHNNRYRIVHKLGYGAYSTTWLARDQQHHLGGRYVAMKIAVAGNGDCADDEFVVHGPNGVYRCLVTLPGRMSLVDAKEPPVTMFRPRVARAIAAQLIDRGVAFLHCSGVVHAAIYVHTRSSFGKHPVLFRLPESLDNLTSSQLYSKHGPPDSTPVTRLDGQPIHSKSVPSHGIMPVWLGEKAKRTPLSEARIFLTDFGEAYLPSVTPRHHSNTADPWVPPEVYFCPQEPLSFPADMWALACSVWSIITQRPLFEAWNPSTDIMIKEHVDVLGKLPGEWWEKCEARRQWFSEDGVRYDGDVGRPFADRFEYSVQGPLQEAGMEAVGEEEKAALFDMLRGMLRFRPERRLSAEEVLGCEWVVKWALPDLGRMELEGQS
ncbi:serine/threonine protein kinase [Helicocarpus griseus UAMH5409]|uniref:non-specific serine/threonine protein kinase n=1 Tax=Helicocarpus griseus UAMH5409 TaxID=1447875 RepID=A0A2B7XZI6_9EURO|nr:serine/threonine protein kinase [Helicocarpus griseus UAMH5409]